MTKPYFRVMMLVLGLLGISLSPLPAMAQPTLSIDNVNTALLLNSGAIIDKGEIKGYYLLYQSAKIDRYTYEYTLQILDENLDKVGNIKVLDSKKLLLLESAQNDNSLSFLFLNQSTGTLDMRVYDLNGRLKYTYSHGINHATDALVSRYTSLHTDQGMSKDIFDIGEEGYVSVLPLQDGEYSTYEVDYYSSRDNSQWSFEPADTDKMSYAQYLGCNDSLIILQVMRRVDDLTTKVSAHIVGISLATHERVFDIDGSKDGYTFVPTNVYPGDTPGKILLMGSYFDKKKNPIEDFSKGLAVYEVSDSGSILSKTYNSWAEDVARFMPVDNRGKIDNEGFLYIHKMLKTPDGKLFLVGEAYKRTVNLAGVAEYAALTALSIETRGLVSVDARYVSFTKMLIKDIVILEFDAKYKVSDAMIYEKTQNQAVSETYDNHLVSQSLRAAFLKTSGAFDYAFTIREPGDSAFTIYYGDYLRSEEYHGETFNFIRYNGAQFSNDRIELKSKATRMDIYPAKPGSIMIMEYFKKEKRLDLRLAKLG